MTSNPLGRIAVLTTGVALNSTYQIIDRNTNQSFNPLTFKHNKGSEAIATGLLVERPRCYAHHHGRFRPKA